MNRVPDRADDDLTRCYLSGGIAVRVLLGFLSNEFASAEKRVRVDLMPPSRLRSSTMLITVLSQKFRLTQQIRATIMRTGRNFRTSPGRKMAETAAPKMAEEELLRMTADVVAAYVSNNTLPTAQL